MQCTYELLHVNTRGRRGKYKRIKVHITLCVYCLVLHIESILDIHYYPFNIGYGLHFICRKVDDNVKSDFPKYIISKVHQIFNALLN